MRMQAVHLDHRHCLHPGQCLRHLLDRHAELRRLAAGRERQVRLGLDAGTDPKQHRRRAGGQPLDPVDVIEAVHDDVADARVDGRLDVRVGLGVAVHDDRGRIGAASQRDAQFTLADDVEAKPFGGQDADHRRRRERLRREANATPRVPARQAVREAREPGRAAPARRRRRQACRIRRPPQSASSRRSAGRRRRWWQMAAAAKDQAYPDRIEAGSASSPARRR